MFGNLKNRISIRTDILLALLQNMYNRKKEKIKWVIKKEQFE